VARHTAEYGIDVPAGPVRSGLLRGPTARPRGRRAWMG